MLRKVIGSRDQMIDSLCKFRPDSAQSGKNSIYFGGKFIVLVDLIDYWAMEINPFSAVCP